MTDATRWTATVDDLYEISGRAELVDGQLRIMEPTGLRPAYSAGAIFASLRDHATRTGRGHALPNNAAFIVELPNRRSFSPDASYYLGELTMKFGDGAPVFAVEVRSEGDYGPAQEKRLAQKRADYFRAGTLVVWDVDLEAEVIRSYAASEPSQPRVFQRSQRADAEPAVPGWEFDVEALFPDH